MRILMVCLGNICRSPLAEGILKNKIERHNLDWQVDSAGTGHWHVGNLPDPRSIAIAKAKGIDITDQRCRQLEASDFGAFDLILAMDKSNYRNILSLAANESDKEKVKMILAYNTDSTVEEVPDPYWDDNGFAGVYNLLDAACDKLIHSEAVGV